MTTCGKIKPCMESNQQSLTGTPPRLINALVAGFNTVANNIYLIIIPVLLDLFFWVGPRLQIKDLLGPVVNESFSYLLKINAQDMSQRIDLVREIWNTFLERFNLFSFLSTFPIGVPSLLSAEGSVDTPFGSSINLQLSSFGLALLGFLAIIVGGFVLGCLYLNMVSRTTTEKPINLQFKDLMNQVVQSFILVIALIIVFMIVSMPVMLIISVFAIINPGLADIALLFIGFILLWMLIPMVFTPHGIFAFRQNVVQALLTSIRLVRFFLPGTGLFLLTAILIGQGLDVLWRVPPTTSWMTLVGILGHAFIYTSLFAASFVYYRNGMQWMQANLQQNPGRMVKI